MKIKSILLTISLILSALLITGCGKKGESWAYDYEPETEVLALYEDGTAKYKGEKYTYTEDNTYIRLKNNSRNIDIRYEKDGDSFVIYEKSTYKQPGKQQDGLGGIWVADNGWSFAFGEDGKFSEENIFFGHYSVDEKTSCIKLMYDDPIPDIHMYFELNGDELTIEYPWPLVGTVESSKKG